MNFQSHPLPSGSQHKFSQVPKAEIPRSSFDRSHGHKTTFDAGYLIPCYVDEALPGDTFNLKMTGFARLATPIFPIMDNMYMDTQFFSVPIRLIWDNWQKFNGEQKNPGDSNDYTIPQMTSPDGGYTIGSIHDYFGLPTGIEGLEHSALWHRAYNLIFNEWYRDQNLQDSLPVPTDDGPDTVADYVLQRRGKRHDYFTSCLPWPQKGPGVTIPLGSMAPVVTNSANPLMTAISGAFTNKPMFAENGAAEGYLALAGTGNASDESVKFGSETGLQADLSSATAATINSLRQASKFKKYSSVMLAAALATLSSSVAILALLLQTHAFNVLSISVVVLPPLTLALFHKLLLLLSHPRLARYSALLAALVLLFLIKTASHLLLLNIA